MKIRLTENNEWEDETWYFYFEQNDNNLAAFDLIMGKLPDGFSVDFGINLSNEDIEKLPSSTSYLSEHNLCPDINIEKIEKLNESEKLFDLLNKGGLRK